MGAWVALGAGVACLQPTWPVRKHDTRTGVVEAHSAMFVDDGDLQVVEFAMLRLASTRTFVSTRSTHTALHSICP